MVLGRRVESSAPNSPPSPTLGKLKSFTIPDFESMGLKEPPSSTECDPLVQVTSSRIVGTVTKRSCELMLANGAVMKGLATEGNVKEFGNDGLKSVGNNSPDRETPTVAWFTKLELAVQVWPTTQA